MFSHFAVLGFFSVKVSAVCSILSLVQHAQEKLSAVYVLAMLPFLSTLMYGILSYRFRKVRAAEKHGKYVVSVPMATACSAEG